MTISSIAANVISRRGATGVEKLLFLGSSCIYPKFAEQPIKEEAAPNRVRLNQPTSGTPLPRSLGSCFARAYRTATRM